ncbi:hypothetical protein HRbin19_01248 [bacterium HR19]|nr:hypothetical protein HRbin19_01248 [bacterium HR19]
MKLPLRCLRGTYILLLSFFACSYLFSGDALCHEPLFVEGARTMWKGGLMLEFSWEHEKMKKENGFEFLKNNSFELETIYGITPNISVRANLNAGNSEINPILGTRIRFFRFDGFGLQESLSLNFAVSSKGSRGGISFASEGRRFYLFSFFSGELPHSFQKLEIPFGLAFGIRPYLAEYDQPDLVILTEFLRTESAFFGFSVFPSIKNFALQGGILFEADNPNFWIFKINLHIHLNLF